MDSEHRHELKENDLAQSLQHFDEVWKKYGNLILFVTVIFVGIFVVTWSVRSYVQTSRDKSWQELADATSPQALRDVAERSADPARKSMAFLRAADLLLAGAAKPAIAGGLDPQGDLQLAEGMYQSVLNEAKAHKAYRLNAMLGLASIAEGRKDWDKARDLYTQLKTEAGDAYPAMAAQAEYRLEHLDDLDAPIVFGKPQEPTPSDSSAAPSSNMSLTPNLGDMNVLQGASQGPFESPAQQPTTPPADAPSTDESQQP